MSDFQFDVVVLLVMVVAELGVIGYHIIHIHYHTEEHRDATNDRRGPHGPVR